MIATDFVTVLVVQDDHLTRSAMRYVLESKPDIRIVGTASNASNAIELLQLHRPDVVLLDVGLREGTGFDICDARQRLELGSGILVLTDDASAGTVREYLMRGVSGFLLKSVTPAELRSAVFDVAAGRMTLSPSVGQMVRVMMSPSGRRDGLPRVDKPKLTDREMQVMRQLEDGLRNREIAVSLGISKKTVETHVRNVFLKLGVNTRTQAVARMLRV